MLHLCEALQRHILIAVCFLLSRIFMSSERISIFVDGSNFYHYLRELYLGGLAEFDYRSFAQFLTHGRTLVSATYYIGRIRSKGDAKSEQLRRSQQRFVDHLLRAGWHVEYGQMMEYKGIFQEKGVDVHMAVNLLSGAYEDIYDTALAVSSDTDLLPAIQKSQSKKKIIEYVGFVHRPSFHLMKNVDHTTLLHGNDLRQFLR
jgi:uncharacterized LabA/DUF88 family protein